MKKNECEQRETKSTTLPAYINKPYPCPFNELSYAFSSKNSQMLCNSGSERLKVTLYIPSD